LGYSATASLIEFRSGPERGAQRSGQVSRQR
jgi:hypothetical protein